jgi:hypothetical protein
MKNIIQSNERNYIKQLKKIIVDITVNIIRQIKSRRMRWAGHVSRMECVQGFDGKARRKETTWKTKA